MKSQIHAIVSSALLCVGMLAQAGAEHKAIHRVTSQNGSLNLQGSVQSGKERRGPIFKVKKITGNAEVIDQPTMTKY